VVADAGATGAATGAATGGAGAGGGAGAESVVVAGAAATGTGASAGAAGSACGAGAASGVAGGSAAGTTSGAGAETSGSETGVGRCRSRRRGIRRDGARRLDGDSVVGLNGLVAGARGEGRPGKEERCENEARRETTGAPRSARRARRKLP
jgi:hypothetical protein